MKPILLTFDLEYWFESLFIQRYLTGKETDKLSIFVEKLLNFLAETNSSATFFISGKVLNKEPELIKNIFNAGHKIAVHTLNHQPLPELTPEKLTAELKEMKNKIKVLTAETPIGYRAPNFSLNSNTNWALKILKENDFKYDSSIFPYNFPRFIRFFYKNNIYGLSSDLFSPYKINLSDISKGDPNSSLVEFPLSVYHCGLFKVPLSGGIYFRLMPWWLFKKLLKNEPACLYFHPFDFLEQAPDIKMPQLKKNIKYYNTKKTWKKLAYLLNKYECISIERYFKVTPLKGL